MFNLRLIDTAFVNLEDFCKEGEKLARSYLLAHSRGGLEANRFVHRTCLKHQNDRRVIVLGHQYGRRDVM